MRKEEYHKNDSNGRHNLLKGININSPVPLYYQLRCLLHEKIKKREWKVGDLVSGEEKLCRIYKLSQVTVRHALSELVQEGFLYRHRGKGTFVCNPKSQPQLQAQGRVKRIGLAVYNLDYVTNPFFSKIISGIDRILEKNGYDLRILSTNSQYAKFRKNPFYLRALEEKSIEGLLLLSQELSDGEILSIRRRNIPMVLINHHIPGKSLNCVFLDNEGGIYQATKYLIDMGHKRIAFITGPQKHRSVQEKLGGYKLALDKHNLSYDENLILESPYENNTAYQSAEKLLRLSSLPTAILAGDDTMAVEIIKVIKSKGLKVPDDISVIGSNDMLRQTKPPLTTMRVPMMRMGELSTQMLLKIINKERVDRAELVLKLKLVTRQTCKKIDKRIELLKRLET